MDVQALLEENRRLKEQLQKKDKELYSIQRIGKALGSTLRLNKLLRLIMQEITQLMDADRSTLYIVDHERGELWAKIALKAETREIRQKIGHGISGHVAATGKVVNAPDVYQDPRFDPRTDARTGYKTRSMLCVPVWEPHAPEENRRIIGVIQVLNKITGVFDKEDEELLETLATQIAISLTNAWLYERVERRLQEMDLLYVLEQELNATYDFPFLLGNLLKKTVGHLKARWVWTLIPREEAYLLVGVNQEGQIHMDQSQKIVRGESEAFGKNPTFAGLQRYWQYISQRLGIPAPGKISRETTLLSPIGEKRRPGGWLFAIDVRVGEALNFADEARLLELVAQKIFRAHQLNQLQESLFQRERLSAIGQMLSTVVHDIRSPVSTINGFVDLMADEMTTPAERAEYAGIIREEIRATINMITEVLDFARGKTSILPRKTGVRNLLQRFRPRLEQMCRDFGTALEVEVHSNEVIYVDEDKVNRVFYNIAKNALEAMRQGGRLLFRVYNEEDHVVFQFTDSGPGIPREIQHRLFDSFVTSGKESGTGLGLAIVKKIIDEHGGRVVIDSQPNQGATFRIKLPTYAKHANSISRGVVQKGVA